jgi:hypothetical protein
MFKSLGFKKIINQKINPNLFGFDNFILINNLPTYNYNSQSIVSKKNNYNYKTFRYSHTHSKTLFTKNNQSSKLTPHHNCSNKILSNDEFDSKIRNIVQEELNKINIDTKNNNIKDSINNVNQINKNDKELPSIFIILLGIIVLFTKVDIN